MTPRDSQPQAATHTSPPDGADVWAGRSMPAPTVLSMIWEGSTTTGTHSAADLGSGHDEYSPSLGVEQPTWGSRVIAWMLTPATRRRVLVITTLAAATCAGLLTASELTRGGTSSTGSAPISVTRGDLTSQAVVTDNGGTPAEAIALAGDPKETVSADGELQLTVENSGTADRSWMLEAELLVDDARIGTADDGGTPVTPIITFTVNGVVVEQVTSSPFRLLLTPELLAANAAVANIDGQVLIVTASAVDTSGEHAAGPATLIVHG